MYGKLINGNLQPAPNPIFIDPYWVGNAENTPETRQMLVEEGYKPVRYTTPPTVEPGYVAVSGWEETETEIVQTWTIEQDSGEIDDSEALNIILGGSE